jgi:hypothetical protein
MSKNFSIVYNLETLNDAQRDQYKRDVSEFFGLDPATNWFDILWIADEGTGMKKLQLYARRGTTDVLRSQREINVISLTQHDGPGYVSFTAVGKDKNGRQEIAVGAHSTEGLKGEKLAAAVATAETRAGRRLTLKFVGLGILDYSEVNQDAPLSAPAPDVQLASTSVVFPPMPKISPNPAPGKDVTVSTTINHNEGTIAHEKPIDPDRYGSYNNLKAPESAKPSMQEMRDEAIRQLHSKDVTKQVLAEAEAGLPGSLYTPVSANVETPQTSETASTEPVKKARKPRGPNKKRNTVDMSSPGQVSTPPAQATDPIIVEAAKALGTIPAAVAFQINEAMRTQANPVVPTQANPAVPPLAETPKYAGTPHEALTPPTPTVPPISSLSSVPISGTLVPNQGTDFPGKPTKEQEEGYRVFLREYANNVLPMAGMRPSEGIGGASAKLRLFAERQSGKATSHMTVDDWEEFKAFFPDFLSRNSPQNLVKYINDVIGAK